MRILIDGTNMVHRDYHAAGIDRVVSLTKQRIDAFRAQWAPDRVMAAFDCGPTFRNRLYGPYKQGREKPYDIDDAIEMVQEACLDEAVDVVVVADFEADDCLATLARIAIEHSHQVVVYSADKDLHQIIQPRHVTQLKSVKRNGGEMLCDWVNSQRMIEKYGVAPHQWVDYRIMTGDSSDNVDGIRNIGPKTAVEVIKACGSLEEFYRNPFKAGITARQQSLMLRAQDRVPLLREPNKEV